MSDKKKDLESLKKETLEKYGSLHKKLGNCLDCENCYIDTSTSYAKMGHEVITLITSLVYSCGTARIFTKDFNKDFTEKVYENG